MNQSARHKRKHGPSALVAGVAFMAASMLLAGCADPDLPIVYHPENYDYRARHPVTVESATAQAWIEFNEDGSISEGDIAKMERYFRAFISAGHGKITATLARQGLSSEILTRRAKLLRKAATVSGIRARELEIRVADAIKSPNSSAGAGLNFLRYVAGLPGCPDWSKKVIDNTYNTNHSNFGCATQTNLGLMIVDPADLVRKRKSTPIDAPLADNAVRAVRIPTNHPKAGVGTVAAGAELIAPTSTSGTGVGSTTQAGAAGGGTQTGETTQTGTGDAN